MDIYCVRGVGMWTFTALGALGFGHRFTGQWDVDTYCLSGVETLTALGALGSGNSSPC